MIKTALRIASTLCALTGAGCVSTPSVVKDFSSIYGDAPHYQKMQLAVYEGRISDELVRKIGEFYGCGEKRARDFINAQRQVYLDWKVLNEERQTPNLIALYAEIDAKLRAESSFPGNLKELEEAQRKLDRRPETKGKLEAVIASVKTKK